jgi:hypothetical protein
MPRHLPDGFAGLPLRLIRNIRVALVKGQGTPHRLRIDAFRAIKLDERDAVAREARRGNEEEDSPSPKHDQEHDMVMSIPLSIDANRHHEAKRAGTLW